MLDARETGRLEAISLQDREPDLNLVEPRSVLGGEVKLEPIAMPSIPVAGLLADVDVEVVQHQMNSAAGVRVRNPIQEGQEVGLLARLVAPTQDMPSAHVEARQQTGRSMPDVLGLESSSFAGRWGNDRRLSLQSLNACLLVNRKNGLPSPGENGVHLDDVSHPLEEAFIFAVHPHLEPKRLQVRLVENAPDRCGADRRHLLGVEQGALKRAQAPLRPLDAVVRRQVARQGNDLVAFLRSDSRRSARPGLLDESLQAALNEPAPPEQNSVPAAPDQSLDLRVRLPGIGEEENASTLNEAVFSGAAATLAHQLAPLGAREANPVFRLWSWHGDDLQNHSWRPRADLANKTLGKFSGTVY